MQNRNINHPKVSRGTIELSDDECMPLQINILYKFVILMKNMEIHQEHGHCNKAVL